MSDNDKAIQPFTIVKHMGDPNTAVTLDGYKVQRYDKLFIKDFGAFVKCAPYDNHFIYREPTGKLGRWSYMCTCGGPAVYVGADAYGHLGSPEGMMFVCYIHTLTNKHGDGSS